MANTIPDIKLSGTSYQNLYALTGIPVGTPVLIQNKQSVAVYLQLSPSAPDSASRDGFMLVGNEACIVKGTITGIWAFGTSRICVQILD